MLKLTRKVEYALIALRHMQAKPRESITSTKEIAGQYGIPQQLLAKTLQQMARQQLIEAIQGPNGGYRIEADLSRINLIQFFENLEGPLGMMDCYFDSDCIQMDACNIRMPIQKINANLRDMLSKMTVQEVTS